MLIELIERARRTDPQTSKVAALNSAKFAASHAGRILAALKTHGPRSAHEIGLIAGLTVVQVDRRLPELRAANLAEVVKLDDGADMVRQGCRVWSAC